MIAKVKDTVKNFLKDMVEVEEIRIVRVDKADSGWIAEADVAAKNLYLTSIRPEYRVFDKEHYVVKLNGDLEVSSYKRVDDSEDIREDVTYGF